MTSLQNTAENNKYVLLTSKHLILVQVNFSMMELCLRSKVDISKKSRGVITQIHSTRVRDEDLVVGLAEVTKQTSMKMLNPEPRTVLKLYRIDGNRLKSVALKGSDLRLNYEFTDKTLKFL